MPDEMKVDIDVMVPVSANLSKVRMITRGFRKPNGTMEGNYLLSYSANSQQFTLIYDTTLRTHIDIASYYNINTASILGGGYATINKFSQHILLESYMPGAFHEPRIISSVAFKNAFRQLLPNAKIVIGDDGMQNMDKYRKDELGENYKEKYENNNESNGEGDDLPF